MVVWKEKYGITIPISPSLVAKLMVMKLFNQRPLKNIKEDQLKAVTVKVGNGSSMFMGRDRRRTLNG